jgi:hypothetical protein
MGMGMSPQVGFIYQLSPQSLAGERKSNRKKEEDEGAEFAENRNDKIVRQGVEQVTLSGDLRRFSVPLAARHVVAGGIVLMKSKRERGKRGVFQ